MIKNNINNNSFPISNLNDSLNKLSKLINSQKKNQDKNVNFIVFSYATQAKIMAPLGPTLGQFNVNLSEFCLKFNKSTEKFSPGLFLISKITKKLKAKEFFYQINPPSIKILLEILTSNFYETDDVDKIEKASLNLELVYDLILLFSFFNNNLNLEQSASFVFSYLKTCGYLKKINNLKP